MELKDVFRGFDYFAVSWVMAIIGGLSILFGFILFIIPGFILIFLFQYAIPIAIGEKLGAMDSLKKSYRIGRENFQFSIILGVIILLINLIGAVLGVGWAITYPFSILCFWIAARELMEDNKII